MKEHSGAVQTSAAIKVLAGTIAAVVVIATPIITIGGYKSKVEAHDQEIPKLWTTASGAKSMAEDALSLGSDLKEQVNDIRVGQETFRKEYREDQKDLDKKLGELLRAVKA